DAEHSTPGRIRLRACLTPDRNTSREKQTQEHGSDPPTRSWASCASCGRPTVFPRQRGDPVPAVEPAQPDLLGDGQADEQDERGGLGGQRALGLHAPAELLVQALDQSVGRSVFPLALRELEENEQLLGPPRRWRLAFSCPSIMGTMSPHIEAAA